MSKHSKHSQLGTAALQFLHDAGAEFEVLRYESHPGSPHGFALDAVEQLGVDPAALFKTLVVDLEHADPVFAVIPADSSLSLKRLAQAAGAKHARLLQPAKAQRLTGYVVGGISALGSKTALRVFVAEEAAVLPKMVVSAGARGVSVRLAPELFGELTGAVFAEITQG
ncbi:aminoacyl-tRNA deacylase [Boudabousia marimammalium]|uniref:Cys-tRNA(Pro)/Cys-tRNA(Cys) deacylase n=1 Tax=Boudabousia marimammalium TaxID=156892 RepID=A0A1Q5PSF0_9ACTO|nr:aminoacyl-tRNA deacylase [Boudabousia marimammalium]OKL50362.1 hypothetical protein BM477_02995 [Boudabousia marimammalium]